MLTTEEGQEQEQGEAPELALEMQASHRRAQEDLIFQQSPTRQLTRLLSFLSAASVTAAAAAVSESINRNGQGFEEQSGSSLLWPHLHLFHWTMPSIFCIKHGRKDRTARV